MLALSSLGALTASGLAAWAYMPGGYMTADARRYRTLLADPMAADPLLGHQAVRNDLKEPDGILGKGVRPWVRNYFRDDSIGPIALAAKFLDYAGQVGWDIETSTSENSTRKAYKSHPGLETKMVLTIIDYTNHPNPTHDPEQPIQKLVSVKLI